MTDWRRSQATIRLLSPYCTDRMRFECNRETTAALPQRAFAVGESERGFVNKSYRKKRSGKKRKILGKTEVKR